MKLIKLNLADGQSISINSAQIIKMQPIIHEDYDAKTYIYLENGKDYLVVETVNEIEKIINTK